ncbi:MAG: hypothetical protein RLZZ444_3558 [Pseudomonadota bacterium]|jgi:hypothetical protein
MTTVSSSSGTYSVYYASRRVGVGRTNRDAEDQPAADESGSSWPREASDDQRAVVREKSEEKSTEAVSDEVFRNLAQPQVAGGETPESLVTSEALDVLVQLRPQAGMVTSVEAALSANAQPSLSARYENAELFGPGLVAAYSASDADDRAALASQPAAPVVDVAPAVQDLAIAEPISDAADLLNMLST